jgi:FkbM family methyltransferase
MSMPARLEGGPVRRMARAVSLVVRHPKRAYRALYAAGRSGSISPPTDAERFAQALRVLTGIDVSLTFERNGVVWTVPPGEDGIGDALFAHGAYGARTLDQMMNFVTTRRPGRSWIIDVGANIGTTSVPFAKAGFEVLAIEPVPLTARYLRKNVDANGLTDHVRILEWAIASDVDEVLIAVSTSLGSSEVVPSSAAAAGFERRYQRESTIVVPALSLDAALAQSGVPVDEVAIVWSDTQASEAAVIDSGSSLWTAGVPLLTEFWPGGLALKGGVDHFIEVAGQHFKSFVNTVDRDHPFFQAMSTEGSMDVEARPLRELHELAKVVAVYPGEFTDILLVP